MNHKTAYLWGPLSSFTAPAAAWLINKGWHVHIATKSTLNLLSLSSLDLASSARVCLENALGGQGAFRTFHDRLKLVEPTELVRDTKYDALIFSGLPPNYDDARVPRAPWTAEELPRIAKLLKGVPIFLISSLWGGIQKDRVVPEELEFERRKPLSHWERICQNYEIRLLKGLSKIEANWFFVRMPMLSGATTSGEPFVFNGPSNIFRELDPQEEKERAGEVNPRAKSGVTKTVKLAYNPDSTFWFLPVDVAVYMFWRFLEDEHRPRICNFVSTQASLNREWLQHLARALGLKEIVQSEKDSLNLSLVLRKLLLDDVQVKTRNLFEAAGRYQLPPVKLDREYFDKVVHAGRLKQWGHAKIETPQPFHFSQRLATYYFEKFVPSQFTENLLKKATKGGTTIGFVLKDSGGTGWVLKSPNGVAVVERYERTGEKPSICFNFSGQTMTRLIQSKLPLHRALLLREVDVEGPLLEALRVAQVIDKFLKQHPMNAEELSSLQREGELKEELTPK
jgi:hypothetical protein